ncbi:MAG: transcriptional repressor [Chloroflexota bacterium]|nr:transcriptional repressor [Chloroflexota bacterium]
MLDDAARLQERGYRLTEPRRTIIAALRGAGRYQTATQIHERLRARGVALASVYRTLELLAELGLAERRAEAGGEASFLYCSPRRHHHVICTGCGAVREIDAAPCPGDELARAVERETDFRIERHVLDFYGLCGDCCASPTGREMRTVSHGPGDGDG